MSCSVLTSTLPNLDTLNPSTRSQDPDYRRNLSVLLLVLDVAKETAQAVSGVFQKHPDSLEPNAVGYRVFDALIGNMGCQVTAAWVLKTLKDKVSLVQESEQVNKKTLERIEEVKKHLWPKPPKQTEPDVLSYLQNLKLSSGAPMDFLISPEMAQLIRFRLLKLVNFNEQDFKVFGKKRERPVMRTDELQMRNNVHCNSSLGKGRTVSSTFFNTWIKGLQLQESQQTRGSLQNMAENLNYKKRALFLLEMVGNDYLSKQKAMPQYYAFEVALRTIAEHRSVAVLRQKTDFCDQLDPEAKPVQIWVQFTSEGERILSREEVEALDKKLPVAVIEGYMNPDTRAVSENIKADGLMQFAGASLARLDLEHEAFPSYPKEAQEEIQLLAKSPQLFEADHMFCGMVGTEYDQKAIL